MPRPTQGKGPSKRPADPETSFHEVQIQNGKGKRWQTRYSFKGDGLNALKYYKGVNVGSGVKKRFVVDGQIVHTTHGV